MHQRPSVVVSSYLLDEANNVRISEAASRHGARFIPASGTREERIAQLDERIAEADILFGGRLSEEQWRKAGRLKWIHVPWAGVNSLFTVEAIRESDIVITNSSGVMSDGVADQVMAYVLLFSRDLVPQIHAQPRRDWRGYSVEGKERRRLRGSTIGIIGYGAIGRAVAERARSFGMRTIATRRTPSQTPEELDLLLGSNQLPRLLEVSDYVVIATPLTDETRGMIGREEIERMKPTAYLINIARGAIVREEELIDALRSRRIAGAALDVFEKEPLPAESQLWDLDNAILTPHSAGGYDGFWDATTDLFIDNLDRFYSGQELRNRVRMEAGY